MVSATQADAGISTGAAVPPPGMVLPVQALSMGFVHEALPLPLHASQAPLAVAQAAAQAAVPSSISPLAGAVPAAGQEAPGAGAAWGLPADARPGAAQTDFAQAGGLAPLAAAPAAMPPSAEPVAGMAPFGPAVFAPGAVVDDTQSRQGVRIGDVGVMLTYEDSSELTEMPELYYLPNAPVWVKGLANLHGNLVPVFDLAQYLGVQAQPGEQAAAGQAAGASKTMLLVLGHGAEAAGVVIDGIPQRLVPTPQQQTDADTAPALLMPHIQGAYFINDHLWFDLDCASLLDMLEQAMMHQA
ncbi:MAG: chemotaxis protein CheW [Brachymonas sp.]|nr:chemotaxis protein CheW [Brachymonas sp.]